MNLFIYGLPAGAAIIGAVAYIFAQLESRKFDRRFGQRKPMPAAIRDLFDKRHA